MSFITDEILKVIQEFNLNVEILSQEKYQYVFENVVSKFAANNSSFPLWEYIIDEITIRDENAWKYIPQFVDDNVILFLEKGEGKNAFMFKQSDHLRILLENSFHFVFYVTNSSFDYLLCFNDHDCLIGSGTSKKWIGSINQ